MIKQLEIAQTAQALIQLLEQNVPENIDKGATVRKLHATTLEQAKEFVREYHKPANLNKGDTQ
jgi:hypothetical protein